MTTSVPSVISKHWRSMVARDTYMGEVFERPPITAYRRQPNLRNYLIRAKVPNNTREKKKT